MAHRTRDWCRLRPLLLPRLRQSAQGLPPRSGGTDFRMNDRYSSLADPQQTGRWRFDSDAYRIARGQMNPAQRALDGW